MPAVTLAATDIGRKLLDVLAASGVVASKSEGRRLIQQSGLTLNDERIGDADRVLLAADFKDGSALLRKGKKKYYRLQLL